MKYILFLIIAYYLSGCSTYEIQRDPIFEETKIRNSRPKLQQEVFDAKETEQKYKDIFFDVDLLVERKVGNVERDKDFIIEFWRQKKTVLKNKYGIDWKSPSELNPEICYESYGQPCISESEELAIIKVVQANSSAPSEIIKGAYRDFRGIVYVGVHDELTGVSRQYRLIGRETEWKLLSVSIIDE
ncbi:hypothetical protein P886_0783 [Alteromonadaceae bacterium 2753L.S.0a.02]|nr:hypothetical protein P886_0783 [Alteromonadaceae bacterium 2753L.S.0a.02]